MEPDICQDLQLKVWQNHRVNFPVGNDESTRTAEGDELAILRIWSHPYLYTENRDNPIINSVTKQYLKLRLEEGSWDEESDRPYLMAQLPQISAGTYTMGPEVHMNEFESYYDSLWTKDERDNENWVNGSRVSVDRRLHFICWDVSGKCTDHKCLCTSDSINHRGWNRENYLEH